MNRPEELDFVHTFVAGRSTRTLLLLHGTGGNENDLILLGRELDPDANLLSPRGKVLENGMPRFFRRLAEGIFDEEDLIRRTHELADFIEQASAKYRLNRQTLCIRLLEWRQHSREPAPASTADFGWCNTSTTDGADRS